MKYLLQTVESYRVDSEEAAQALIAEAKSASEYELKKYTSEYKEQKAKGEVVDAWWRVTLTKKFTEEKEPIGNTEIEYTIGG